MAAAWATWTINSITQAQIRQSSDLALEGTKEFERSWLPPASFFYAQCRLIKAHLRSINEMAGFYGYQIQALDHAFGRIEQFIFDDQNWRIRYLVADTHTWIPGKRVLLAPQWIAWISWSEARAYVDFDAETIRRAPEYELSAEITPEFEQKLREHYARSGNRGKLAA